MVSAVTIPDGKGSRSRSRSWLRNPAATTMPSRLTTINHIARTGKERVWPVIRASAGMGAASPAEMIEAEADAAVWLMLFSLRVQTEARFQRSAERQKAKAMRPAATDMLNVQPILRPV